MTDIAPHQIETDTLPYDYIARLQQGAADKIYNPLHDEEAHQALQQRVADWRRQGLTTVFTSGVFDLLHFDHSGYLLHTKATGAAQHFRRNSRLNWNDLKPADQQDYTREVLIANSLRLIVSIDGDKSVAARKGFNPHKGNSVRPIYAWRTRALQVATQSFTHPDATQEGPMLPIVDAVTIHGEEDFPLQHPHASHFDLVEDLQPDVWAFFGESKDIKDEAPFRPGLGNVALRAIMDGEGTEYFRDDVIGKMSTTKIVNRIVGTS